MSTGRPRPLAPALRTIRDRAAPRTPLGAVQGRWREIAGEAIAAEAEPVSERDGVVTVACRSSTWAQELDLLQGEILSRLRKALPEDAPKALRFTADASRFRT